MLHATQMNVGKSSVNWGFTEFYPYSFELHTTCCLVYDGLKERYVLHNYSTNVNYSSTERINFIHIVAGLVKENSCLPMVYSLLPISF